VEPQKGKMMEDTGEDILRAKPSPITTFFKRIGQMYQKALDESTQYTKGRWIAFLALNVCFLLRIVLKQACSVCLSAGYFSLLSCT